MVSKCGWQPPDDVPCFFRAAYVVDTNPVCGKHLTALLQWALSSAKNVTVSLAQPKETAR